MNDDELTRLATEELLREARRGAVRAETMGPQGWRPCPLPRANKTFLNNTLRQTVNNNRRNVTQNNQNK